MIGEQGGELIPITRHLASQVGLQPLPIRGQAFLPMPVGGLLPLLPLGRGSCPIILWIGRFLVIFVPLAIVPYV